MRLRTAAVALLAGMGLVVVPSIVSFGVVSPPALAAPQAAREDRDVVRWLVESGRFKTLGAAVQAAGLAEALQNGANLTLFAPTDAAFEQLGADRVGALLKPENKGRLTDILKYHVVAGRVLAAEFVSLPDVTTLDGQRLVASIMDGQLAAGRSKIIQADIPVRNGVIHVIDTVLLPERENIVKKAESAGKFKTLLAAATAAGLAGPLSGEGPFTVLAPNDDAFRKLPAGTVEALLKPENAEQLATILKLHVIPSRIYARAVVAASSAETLAGQKLNFAIEDGRLAVRAGNVAKIIATDIDASNGVIHVLDSVLLPVNAGGTNTASMSRAGSGTPMTADAIMGLAIERGVPLFNAGDHGACAAVYEVAANAVLGMSAENLSEAARMSIREALGEAANIHDATDRAWALRRGLDRAMAQMMK
ncbi:MAG: fasciclin domain-containing protein [Phycisphaerae bacterium]|nr:fasciclin domain-containing protein [Phycisphaerae bacterium]